MREGAFCLALVVLLAAGCSSPPVKDSRSPSPPLPVVVDTDIGGDIDDTWALAFLLRSPQVRLRLVLTTGPDRRGKARLAAKFLDRAGAGHVPLALGLDRPGEAGPQSPWARDYPLALYAGPIHADGVAALRAFLEAGSSSSPSPTLLLLGPSSTLAAALASRPELAGCCRLVMMGGSLRRGYREGEGAVAEYNLAQDPRAARQVLSAPWRRRVLIPLDVAARLELRGTSYRRLLDSPRPALRALLEAYRIWAAGVEWIQVDPQQESSPLYDLAASLFLTHPQFFSTQVLPLQVGADGRTRVQQGGVPLEVATEWADLGAALKMVVQVLSGAEEAPP